MKTISELLDIARGELGSTWMLNDPPLGPIFRSCPTGKKGPIGGPCPNCGATGDWCLWDAASDICTCKKCGWKSVDSAGEKIVGEDEHGNGQ